MSIDSYCRRPASTVAPDDTLVGAAQRMEKEGIGFLVVTEDGRTTGVITDRDVALHVIAGGRDASEARIRDAMSRPAISADVGDSIPHALTRMSRARVRRLPVVDGERLEGVVSADDLVMLLAREIGDLAEVLAAQLPVVASRTIGHEAPEPPGPRLAEHYGKEVVHASTEDPVSAIAREMQDRAVGCVVLLDVHRKAIGLVTDRDLALRVVAAGLDPVRTPASVVMSAPLIVAQTSDPLEEVIAQMRTAGVRRIPVLRDGRPVGLVSFDDLLVTFGRQLDQLAEGVAEEIRTARTHSYPARLRHELEDRIEEASTRLRDAGDQTLRTLGRAVDQVVDRVADVVRGKGSRARPSHLSVADLMRTEVRTCTPEDALSEPARIMWERDCGCVPVVAQDGSGRVVGMITDRDLCMATYTSGARLAEMQVKNVMTRRVFSCHPGDSLLEAEATMRSAQVRRLPVIDEAGHLRGLLSLADIAEAAAGIRAPAGTVSPAEVGIVLEAVCRPRSQLMKKQDTELG